MTGQELGALLKDSGVVNEQSVAYGRFEFAPGTIPYIIYHETTPDILHADNRNWHMERSFTVELYTDRNRPDMELALEQAFDDAELPFTKAGKAWIESDKMYQIAYYL